MKRLMTKMKGLLVQEEGQDIVEYALLAAFIAIVAAAILVSIGDELQIIYNDILAALKG